MLTKNKIVRLIGVLLIVIFPLSGSVFSNEVYAQGEIPTLYAEISFDWVDGRNWPLGDYVTLTIEDPDTTLSPDYTDTQIVGTDQLPTYVRFDVWEDGFDLEPGHIVTLTNGPITKTHTALNIGITNVNLDSWYVEGFAPSLGSLMVTAHDPCWETVPVTADMMTGYWKAIFMCDLNTVEFIHAEMQGSEEAGVSTGFFWDWPPPPPEPTLQVELRDNWVLGRNWPLGSEVTMTVEDPNTSEAPDFTATQIVGEDSHGTVVEFNHWEDSLDLDLEPGHIVSLTGGDTTLTHTALNLNITKVDVASNSVEGYSDTFSEVTVTAHSPCWEENTVQANGDGYWLANFNCDLNTVEYIHAERLGTMNTYTSFFWGTPVFNVDLFYDTVYSFGWLPGATVTMTIDDPDVPGTVNYTESKVVEVKPKPPFVDVNFDLRGVYYIEPGQIVTLSDSGVTTSHVVEYLEVTRIDTNTDEIEGFADAGKEIFVTLGDPHWIDEPVHANDVTGEWYANFSGVADIVPGEWGFVSTSVTWDYNFTLYSWFAPILNTYEIGFWQDAETVSAGDDIVLRTGWGACTSGLVKAFQKDAHIDLTINGERLYPAGDEALYWGAIEPIELEGCKAAPDGNQASGSAWRYPLGSLEPGIYEVYVHYWLDHPMVDGGDWDGDGKMDKFEGTLVENIITIVVK